MSLFRPEALEAQSKTGMGDVIITQPRIFMVMTAFSVVVTMALAAFFTFGQFSRKETVLGYLAPRDGVAVLTAQRGGIVSELLVSEGDLVEAGDILIRLTTDQAAADGQAALANQIEQTNARLAEARLQLSVAEAQFRAQGERLQDRINGLEAEVTQLRVRLDLARESEEIARSQWERWQSLAERGLAPAIEVDARRQALISAQASRSDIARLLSEREGELRDTAHSLTLLPTERDLSLSRTRSDIAALEQSRGELARASGYALTAPVSGQVSALQAIEGAATLPNQALVAILPSGSDLRAHLLAPSRASGFVEAGQEVRLRVDAFPYQRFGAVDGRITEVSGSVLAPHELVAPIPVQESVYRITVEIDAQSVSAYGADEPLQAGMTLQADVLVDRRPLWRWFIDPVMAMRGG